MVDQPRSPLLTTRQGPTFQSLAQANRSLGLFGAQGSGVLDRFNEEPPPYRSRSQTPIDVDEPDEQEEDPALLRRLEEAARNIPIKWAADPYAGMTQEEKQQALRWEKGLLERYEERMREGKERHEKQWDRQPEFGLFGAKPTFGSSPPAESAESSIARGRKRKRDEDSDVSGGHEAGSPELEHDTASPP
jgi:hypothetical protein